MILPTMIIVDDAMLLANTIEKNEKDCKAHKMVKMH